MTVMNQGPIHVLLGTDNNYVPGAVVTMVSIINASTTNSEFVFHLMDTGISEENCEKLHDFLSIYPNTTLEIHKIDVSCFEKLGAKNFDGTGFSAYARLLATDLLQEDKCIYVDTDFLVVKDFQELWNYDLNDYAFAACLNTSKGGVPDCDRLCFDCSFDTSGEIKQYAYFNSGLMVCNLKFWRAFEFKEKAFDLIFRYGKSLRFADQTVINYLFRGKTLTLPPEWNTTPWWTRPLISDANIHFTSKFKPWSYRFFLPAEKMWFALYDQEVKPRWDVVKLSRKRLKGLYMFMRWYGIPALFPRLYCWLRKTFRNDDETRQKNDFIQFKAMNRLLWRGPDVQTKKTIRDYVASIET